MSSTQIHIYGKNPVQEAIKTHPDSVERLFIRSGVEKHAISSLLEQCTEAGVPVQYVPDDHIESMVGPVNDQGFVAVLSSFPYHDLDAFITTLDVETLPAVVILDEVQDPHNVGAIIRSAAAFGAAAVIIPKHKQAGVTAAVFKASAGAVLSIPIVQVTNISVAIEKLKKARFWVAGISQDGERHIWEEKIETPLAFVLGGEGKGLRPNTKEKCDFLLSIPMQKDIESLNVSVASAITLYEWSKQKRVR